MAKILNTLLSAAGVFLLTFVWIVYCTKDSTAAGALAAVTALSAGYIVHRAQNFAENRKATKNAPAKKAAALGEFFRFGENNGALIAEMLKYYRFEILRCDAEEIVAQKEGEKCFFALRYAPDAANKEEIARCVVAARRAQCDKLYLLAHKADKTALKQAEGYIRIMFADDANMFQLLETSGKLPPLPDKKISKPHFIPLAAFCRKRFGWYFASALFMLALSALSYIKWYTLFWATVSLALALFSLVNRRYNTQPTHVTLD